MNENNKFFALFLFYKWTKFNVDKVTSNGLFNPVQIQFAKDFVISYMLYGFIKEYFLNTTNASRQYDVD